MSSDLTVSLASWEADKQILRELRETVFIREQGIAKEIEWDGHDAQAEHVIAHRAGSPVACGRLMTDGKIGRMAVLKAERGKGVGAAVLAELVRVAQRRGLLQVHLSAQTHAAGFYSAEGFTATDQPFLEAGIEHIAMTRDVDYRDCRIPVSPVQFPHPFAQLLLTLATSARRQLDILSPDLDPLGFEPPGLVEAVTALCRSHRESRVRIIVADARGLASRGHSLLTLARRLPSSVHIRQLTEHPEWPGDTCALRDLDGLLLMPAGNRSRGSFHPEDRAGVAREKDRFENLWRNAHEAPELRRLHL